MCTKSEGSGEAARTLVAYVIGTKTSWAGLFDSSSGSEVGGMGRGIEIIYQALFYHTMSQSQSLAIVKVEMSHVMRLWYFSFFKHACAAIQWN